MSRQEAIDATEAVLRAELERRLHRRASHRLIDWVRATSGPSYHVGWVHEEICAALERFSQDVAAMKSPRLMIAMPPRLGKSHIVSQRFPIWHMARNPGHEVVCASYGAELAEDHSRDARAIAQNDLLPAVFGNLHLRVEGKPGETDRVSKWRLPNGSSYTAVGVGGALTGRGAHVAIIDDPFKDRADADSPAQRRKVWRWYMSTLYTRLAPGAGIIVMNTRWHPDDLSGRLDAAEMAAAQREEDEDVEVDRWTRLIYPAIAEQDEPHRKAGEALHPERFPLRALRKIKAAITEREGPREWAALYQQRPIPESGGRIQEGWFSERYVDPPERMAAECDEISISVDSAKKNNDANDLHAIHVWGRKGPKRILLDRVAGRWSYPQFERALDNVIERWAGPIAHTGGICLIEDTANGSTYMQIRAGAYRGVSLVPFSPQETPGKDKSKGARAVYLERAAEAGQILLPDERICRWVSEVVTWWCAFPLGAHDDDVDAASQLLMRWATREATRDVNRHLLWLVAGS